jgi:hypothetical protein
MNIHFHGETPLKPFPKRIENPTYAVRNAPRNVTAITMNYVEEAIGIVRAAQKMNLNVMGGCCGTDHCHIEPIAQACAPLSTYETVTDCRHSVTVI